MTGCRRGAKNTLLTNYLYLAERAGAVVLPMTTVVGLRPLDGASGAGGWEVATVPTGRLWAGPAARAAPLTARQVVLAAGAYGTQKLLQQMAASGRLSRLSARLGHLTRTNSESLVGASVPRRRQHPDYSTGVAITSSFRPEPRTSVEPVRYGHGSNLMGLLGTLAPACPAQAGLAGWARAAARAPRQLLGYLDLREWSERTVIALVMQSLDNSLTVSARAGAFGDLRLRALPGEGTPSPPRLPLAHEVARRLAEAMDGQAATTWAEVFGVAMTAHLLGGCVIGASAEEGVVDPWQRAYGYEGLHIMDGSVLPANPGVNPALTIAALAERALSHWPNCGEADPRPPVGSAGAPNGGRGGRGRPRPLAELLGEVPVVPPRWPVVPQGAPGAWRLCPA